MSEENNVKNNNVDKEEELRKEILEAIKVNKPISLIFYSLPEEMEKRIDFIVEKIFEKFGKSELKATIYTGIKELAVNGTKANIKKVFFEENNLDIDNPEHYVKGQQMFKANFSEEWAKAYGKKTKERGKYVKVTFFYNEDGFRVDVMNNTPIAQVDEKRMREKLAKAMSYDDIVQFYMEQGDETEGAGMGIALIVMLLKGEGIDPKNFRIGIVNRITTARIEVPFTDKYIPVRERFKQAQG